jgi:ATP-dependent DNA helicase RecQ
LREGKTLEEIAQIRGRQLSTVVSTVAALLEAGLVEFQSGWVSRGKQSVIEAACTKVGMERLKPAKDILPPEITYGEIRLVVGKLRREQNLTKADVPA